MKEQDVLLIIPVKIRFDETSQLQKVQQMFLLQNSLEVCRTFRKFTDLVTNIGDLKQTRMESQMTTFTSVRD